MWVWLKCSKGIFSVNFFFFSLYSGGSEDFPARVIWKPWTPWRFLFFVWLVYWTRVPTMALLVSRVCQFPTGASCVSLMQNLLSILSCIVVKLSQSGVPFWFGYKSAGCFLDPWRSSSGAGVLVQAGLWVLEESLFGTVSHFLCARVYGRIEIWEYLNMLPKSPIRSSIRSLLCFLVGYQWAYRSKGAVFRIGCSSGTFSFLFKSVVFFLGGQLAFHMLAFPLVSSFPFLRF